MRQFLDLVRSYTPLPLRKKIGPIIGYVTFFLRVHVRGKSWEPKVLSALETLKKIKDGHLSAIRFGDGEISLIEGGDLQFQKYETELGKRLSNILTTNMPKLLICIPPIFGNLRKLTKIGYWFEIHHLFRYSHVWQRLTSPNRTYGDAFFARAYLTYKDKSGAGKVYTEIKLLWENEDVVIIEGSKSRLGVGNDLFKSARSLGRILCPPENAYAKVDAIIKEASQLPQETLILLSLGPAAKVIGYELFKRGYRIIDVGHLDMEYEMYLRNSVTQIAVPYKYFNEIGARNPEDCTDPAYLSEIIAEIT